jgi:predicted GH43/DUF377 family glycosyl hydrolase
MLPLFHRVYAGKVIVPGIASEESLWRSWLDVVLRGTGSGSLLERLALDLADACIDGGYDQIPAQLAAKWRRSWEERLRNDPLRIAAEIDDLERLAVAGLLRQTQTGEWDWVSDLLAEHVFHRALLRYDPSIGKEAIRAWLALPPTDRLLRALSQVADDLWSQRQWAQFAEFARSGLGLSCLELMLTRRLATGDLETSPWSELDTFIDILPSQYSKYRICSWIAGEMNHLQMFADALRIQKLALSFAEDEMSLARAVAFQAGVEARDNENFGAYLLYDKAIAAGMANNEPRFVAETWLSKTQTALHRKDWTTFEAAADQAERGARSLDLNTALTHLTQIRGEAHAQRGNWAEAAAHFELSRHEFNVCNDSSGLCAAIGWLGLMKCRLGEMNEGLALVREALRVERSELRSREGVGKWLHLLGEIFADSGQTRRAIGCLFLSRSLREEIGHVEVATTDLLLEQLRYRIGEEEYGEMESHYDSRTSEFSEFSFAWGIGRFDPSPLNPILAPQGVTWERDSVCNPAACLHDDRIYLLYRAEGPDSPNGGHVRSRIGLAISSDGRSFIRESEPIVVPTEKWELSGGCEDPRVVKISDTYHMTYTAYDGQVARLAAATSRDLRLWSKQGLILSDDDWHKYFTESNWQYLTRQAPGRTKPPVGWSKSGALLSQPIRGYYWMYFGDTHIWAAFSRDLRLWEVVPEPVLSPRPGHYDAFLVEPGPPPRLCEEGIWLAYNGAARISDHSDALRYSCAEALFSSDDPTRLRRRSAKPILAPPAEPEPSARVPHQVVFCQGLVGFRKEWLLYYGIGDSQIGLASKPQFGGK